LLKKLRIVQLIPTLHSGGLERIGTTLSLRLAPKVERIVVCTSGGTVFEEPLAEGGLTVVRIPRPRPRPVRLVRTALALASIFRRERPHVVHAHNPAASAAAALARRLARRPEIAIVTTYHGVPEARMVRAAQVLRLTSDFVVGIGPTSTQHLRERGLALTRTSTVYNAVEPEVTRTREAVRREFGAEEAELVVAVGRYAEQKNPLLFVEALALVAPSRPSLRALLVGEGPLEDVLQRRIAELELGHLVVLTGFRADAPDIIAAADVLALTSSWEALGLVVLEAMMLGCPVVSTDAGGVADLVRDGETGLLVPRDDAQALAEGIVRLLDDEPLRRRITANGRAFAEQTSSVDAMVEQYAEVYVAAASARRARFGARPLESA
jgi:glycosyltransferase involved in cell wall biosynthesis